MATELKVPSAGESITEVTIVEWLKKEGEWAALDETIAVIETDKANVELNAPVAGVITKILKGADEEAAVDEIIGEMEAQDAPSDGGGDSAPKAEAKSEEKAPEKKEAPKAESKPAEKAPAAKDTAGEGLKDGVRAPPSVRRAVRQGIISAADVKGTGLQALQEDSGGRAAPEAPAARVEERQKMTRLRKTIAKRLVEAQQNAAILTTFNEVDMGPVMALRKQHQEAFVAKHGIKLGFMSFFVKAAIEALKDIPQVNASIEGEEMVFRNYYDIGVAVGGGKGLVVPVVRNAERLGFAQVEKVIGDFGKRAKANKITPDELQGGTFTISNGGVYGSMMSPPILNPPQSGILGLHNIVQRPVVKNGEITIAPMMYLALSYDHRIVDGREAVTFLVRIKECIENPSRMLLEV